MKFPITAEDVAWGKFCRPCGHIFAEGETATVGFEARRTYLICERCDERRDSTSG